MNPCAYLRTQTTFVCLCVRDDSSLSAFLSTFDIYSALSGAQLNTDKTKVFFGGCHFALPGGFRDSWFVFGLLGRFERHLAGRALAGGVGRCVSAPLSLAAAR